MQVSAEIRWFWRNEPTALREWFCSRDEFCAAGGGAPREDQYLRDARQAELGLKRRGGKAGIEVKGLVAVTSGGLVVGPFLGPIEIWTKWTCEALELPPALTVTIRKERWLRKFDTALTSPEEIALDHNEQPLELKRPLPVLGCNAEVTKVDLQGATWWTLGLESFGTIGTVENSLRAVATLLAARRPPDLGMGQLASYPAWLRNHT